MSLVRNFVVAHENERAFNGVRRVLSGDSPRQSLFIFGVRGSGKSTLVKDIDRALEKPEASMLMVSHAAEIMLNIQWVSNEQFLQNLATTDILVLDDFQDFFESEEVGEAAASSLLRERNKAGKQTILFSKEPFDFFCDTHLSEELADFVIEEMLPLKGESRWRFVECKIAQHTIAGKSPQLDEEAKRYLVDNFNNLHDLNLAILFLMTESNLPNDVLATKREVEALLTV